MSRVRRADFVPDVVWVQREDGWFIRLDRKEDQEAWDKLANSDEYVITQVDDGAGTYGADRGIFPTSSSSAPGVIHEMLNLLDLHSGMDVLEIGTGTGFNAALLAESVMPGYITTVEVDESVADHAREALLKAGVSATVVMGDGTCGYEDNAPYDRIICTASALSVPYAWIEQTRPGGRIVLPYTGSFDRGAFLCLIVDGYGGASGKFHGTASFMRLRGHRAGRALWQIWNTADAHTTTTEEYLREPFVEYDAGFALGLLLPGWMTAEREEDDGEILLMSDRVSNSWATVRPANNGSVTYEVHYDGPHRLWVELEAAYRWWTDAGRPDQTRFGTTVTPEGQTFWLDSPDRTLPNGTIRWE
ncbi:protein-L-isoaspartate(D-aspartate) O-methyltransferase [Candidatus Protofrankia californiensis]|uniref:Protein-L-isoaspartate O-methyltransferase n=1 Tax=Candidatus Protofrankia californiensis TaxID=1839754 RepID=A0A1C3NSZ3_9ACTN|nr:protein-L-isoaspartate(D-aspartate) O-methyltransferase [Candidatus Protofrankia californiensis]